MEHDAVAGLVERILSAKHADPLKETNALEWEIDQRVYRLYTLTQDDITHYQKIVMALSKTIRLMKEIDDVIEKHGGWSNAFQTAKA